MSDRLDATLVLRSLVSTRSKAQALIKEGKVLVNGQTILKTSFKCSEVDEILVNSEKIWVGRGAEKLKGAHEDFALSFENKVIGDMGASTGGFVEYVLNFGAQKVYAIDVGHDQLDSTLREDERVVNKEGINIKEGVHLEELCDLIVVDLSFISLTQVLAPMVACLKEGGEMITLVKPQFEVGRAALGKKGIAKDTQAIQESLLRIFDEMLGQGLKLKDARPCKVKGKTGNQEYFFYGIYDKDFTGIERKDLFKKLGI